ncbi:MAG: polysaccharide biosynthesis protein [Planctomycetota bacterium]|nr:polysaccharide biosynthesis protein [Planctomycetota bacterium]
MEPFPDPRHEPGVRRLPEALAGASVLVTGGTGTTGKLLIQWLLQEAGASRVIAFSRDEQKHHDLIQDPRFQHPALQSMVGDIRDQSRLRHALEGVSLVLHTAAMKHVPIAEANPTEAVRTNIEGTMNLIDASRDAGVSRVIAHSTDKAVEPACIYGATKLVMEKLLIRANAESGASGPRFDIVRHGNLVGSRGSVIPLFEEQMSSGKLTVTDPEMTRFWINGTTLVSIVHRTIVDGRGGEIFVPKLPACRLDTLVKAINQDATIEIIGARPGEKRHEALTAREEACRIREFEEYLVIVPEYSSTSSRTDGTPVTERFQFRSNQAALLDTLEMREFLQGNFPTEPA